MSRSAPTATSLNRTIRRHLLLGAACIAMLAASTGILAASVRVSGAVIASGRLVVDVGVSKVQHQYGGVVRDVLVVQGEAVQAGDVLLRLDDTQLTASAEVIRQSIAELRVRQARLLAEQNGLEKIEYPESIAAWNDASVLGIMRGEEKLFEARRAISDGHKRQLEEQIAQLEQQIAGLTAAEAAKLAEIDWSDRELGAVRESWEKQLVQLSRLAAMERDGARLAGELGQLQAAIADLKGKMAEIGLQVLQVDESQHAEVTEQLGAVGSQLAELGQRQIAAEDQLVRSAMVAPVSGVVNELAGNLAGSVITPGQQVMTIVPSSEKLAVEARVPPQSIEQLSLGQSTTLRFAGLSPDVAEMSGRITFISPDLTQEAQTGAMSYVVRVAIDPSDITELAGAQLVPGMPVDAFVQTGDATMLAYLIKPLSDQVVRAFRE